MQLKEIVSTYRQRFLLLIRYGISGLTGGAIQILFLYAWVTLLGFEKTYLLGVGLGFLVALIVTFLLQKYWAFRDRESSRTSRQFLSYTLVAISGLALNALLLLGAETLCEWLALDFFHGWYLVAQVLIVGIVSIFNFCMNFLFTFRIAGKELREF